MALNLVGVDTDEVPRGTMLGRPDQWRATGSVDAWCEPSGGAVLGRRGAWTAHVGTASMGVSLYPSAAEDLSVPGPVRLTFERPLPLAAGDHLVLREAGRSTTMGGGRVLDPAPGERPRGSANRSSAVVALGELAEASALPARLAALVAHHEELDADEALAGAGATAADLQAAVDAGLLVHLSSSSSGSPATGVLMAPDRWEILSKLAVQSVIGTHQRRPALAAVDPAEPRQLLATTGATAEVVEHVLAGVVADGRLEQIPGGLRAPGHEPRLTIAQQTTRTTLLAELTEVGIEAPPVADLLQRTPDDRTPDDRPPADHPERHHSQDDRDLITALVRDGQLVQLTPDVVVTAAARDQAIDVLRGLQEASGPFTASEAREALGTTRKYLLPLLEHLDAARVTRREGDRRTLRDQSG